LILDDERLGGRRSVDDVDVDDLPADRGERAYALRPCLVQCGLGVGACGLGRGDGTDGVCDDRVH
jgi:hypothetical protein